MAAAKRATHAENILMDAFTAVLDSCGIAEPGCYRKHLAPANPVRFKALGFEIPPKVLALADEVIE